jgi:pyruvate dehydrogenase E2 component (dihydrolipoamide acetyltransferase)
MSTPIVMPRLGDFMTEGVVTKFTKSMGDHVDQGEVVAEIETEKVNYDLEATESGIFHPVVEEGSTVAVDAVMGFLLGEGESIPEASSSTPSRFSKNKRTGLNRKNSPQIVTSNNASMGPVPSTPGARKLASRLGVALEAIVATGPRGRIVEADVRVAAEKKGQDSDTSLILPQGLPDPVETVSFSGMRKAIATNMKQSLVNTAQLSFFFDVDVTEAQSYRRSVGIGLSELLIKASAEALKRVPSMNSVVSGDSYLRFDQVNIAVAVSLDEGLVVPVIRDVSNKDFSDISTELKYLSEQARSGKITPDQLLGGTFTISILGSVDGFTPILNQGQVALLGVGRTKEKPVVITGDIVIREVATLSLTVDHQVIDGAVAANFCRRLQQLIERPLRV